MEGERHWPRPCPKAQTVGEGRGRVGERRRRGEERERGIEKVEERRWRRRLYQKCGVPLSSHVVSCQPSPPFPLRLQPTRGEGLFHLQHTSILPCKEGHAASPPPSLFSPAEDVSRYPRGAPVVVLPLPCSEEQWKNHLGNNDRMSTW